MNLLVLPILIPLASAALGLMAWRSLRWQRALGIGGALALLAAAIALLHRVYTGGILALQLGAWPAPFGITLVADLLGAMMVLLAAVMAVVMFTYSVASVDGRRQSSLYFPLMQIMLMGVCGAFLTGDIFNLYVWFEVLLISSFVLMALGGERPQIEGAVKYVTLNLMSSVFFLTAVGILYGMTGTLNMADLSLRLARADAGNATTVSMLFLVAFGIKSALFPLFFWLPASYHTPPFAISAMFAGVLTKVGVYAILRVFTLLFTQDITYTHSIILVLAAVTMVTGVLGAASQYEFRRILAFHSVSQIGYMVMGIALFTPLAIAGTILFMLHHSVVKSALFLISGVAHRLRGSSDLRDPRLSGLYASAPGLSILFLITALSLAGIPPLSGFLAKLFLIKAGLDAGEYVVVAIALLVGVLTLFSMVKIWAEAFWRSPLPEAPGAGDADDYAHEGAHEGAHTDPTTRLRAELPSTPWSMTAPVAALALLAILLGLAAAPMYTITMAAADQLLDPSQYIAAVLGDAAHTPGDAQPATSPQPEPAP